MPFKLSPEELSHLELLPEADLAELAIEMDLIPEAEIDRRALVEALIPRLYEQAVGEGLPLSKYDRDDLVALPAADRRALAAAMGWPDDVDAMLKRAARVLRTYRKHRPKSQVRLLLPILLPALARYAREQAG